jgi:hypothetical protein
MFFLWPDVSARDHQDAVKLSTLVINLLDKTPKLHRRGIIYWDLH